jgi:hypothetical protein
MVLVSGSTSERQRKLHVMCALGARKCPRRQPLLQLHHPRSAQKASHLPPLPQPKTRKERMKPPSRRNPSGKPCLRPCLIMEWYAKHHFIFCVRWVGIRQTKSTRTIHVPVLCVHIVYYVNKAIKVNKNKKKKKKVSRSLETSVLGPHPLPSPTHVINLYFLILYYNYFFV